MADDTDPSDPPDPTAPPVNPNDDWPYKLQPFPVDTLLRAAMLRALPPPADRPDRLE